MGTSFVQVVTKMLIVVTVAQVCKYTKTTELYILKVNFNDYELFLNTAVIFKRIKEQNNHF